ncbi:MAG: hypothetical protein Q7U78_01050 [Gallionella sp.]|nr:hypothetical protein [Gallionella sp.]
MKQAFITSFALLALLGCATPPMQMVDYEDQPIKHFGSHGVSIEEVRIDIRIAATKAGWDVPPSEIPDRMIATRSDGKASATVEIAYNLKKYSIKYKDSNGLDFLNRCSGKASGGPAKTDEKCISPTYNEWVKGLNDEISRRVQY